ncbi:sulfotransferase family protein [Afifella pfennigii]|uniref:hypothetical protein n=1 Tax=Afifella pfennigii TaxID=209897 RepID=UPI00047BD7EB|nr:hypothetical protein [Afifella pfennigii]
MASRAEDPTRPLYLFCHVPKCAGSTVEGHFDRHLPGRLLFPPRRRGFLRDLGGGYTDTRRLPEGLDTLDFVGGHSLSRRIASHFPGRELRECVLIREPVSLTVSYYNFRNKLAAQRGKGPAPFEPFCRSLPRDVVCRFILTRYLGIGYPQLMRWDTARRFAETEKALSRFWFVGDVRHTEAMVQEISRELGIGEPPIIRENVSNRDGDLKVADLAEEARQEILARNPLDVLLHGRWAEVKWGPPPEPLAKTPPRGDQFAHLAFEIRRLIAGKEVERIRRAAASGSADRATTGVERG